MEKYAMVDLSRIKASLTRLENPRAARSGGGDRPNHLVKLPVGDHTLRITPYKFEPELPFRELHFHYGIGGKSFLCPKEMDGENCPICDYGWELYNEYKETMDENLRTEFRNIMPKLRVYIPVIVKASEDKNIVFDPETNPGIKFWGVSKQAYEWILSETIAADEDGVDITNPSSGLDINVKMEPFQMRKDRFVVKTIKAARKESPLYEDASLHKDILDSCPDIHDIFKKASIAELKEALSNHVNPTAEVDANSAVSTGTTKDYSKRVDSADIDFDAKAKSTDAAIDAAFDSDLG